MSMNTQGRPTGTGTETTGIAPGSSLLPDEPLLFEIGDIEHSGVDLPEASVNDEFLGSFRRKSPLDLAGLTEPEAIEGAPARENTTIFDLHGTGVGRITSGGFSPSLNRAIALGFVTPGHEAPGTQLQVEVRGKLQPASVTALPFVPHRYVRKATA